MKRCDFDCVLVLAAASLAAGDPPAQPEHAAVFARDAVAADHAEASKAGAEVLAAGGNAADAAAATMLALGVVNPASSGLGGGGFALYYCAKDGSLTFLDFRERAPRAATRTMFEARRRAAGGSSQLSFSAGRPRGGRPGRACGNRGPRHALRDALLARGHRAGPSTRRRGLRRERRARRDGKRVRGSASQRPGDVEVGPPAGRGLASSELGRVLRAFAEKGAAVIYGGVIGQEMVAAFRSTGAS